MQNIKQQFFTFRNGIIADTLRKGGLPHSVIFGLQLPQISKIASAISPSLALGRKLWTDRDVRESRLLACWIFPPSELSEKEALDMARDVRSREEADILAFRLLKYTPFAFRLADELKSTGETELIRYAGEALRRNIDK